MALIAGINSFRNISIIFGVLFSLLFIGCEDKKPDGEITVPEETAKVVSQVTSGIISPASAIVVEFNHPVVPYTMIGVTLKDPVFSFDLSISGAAHWEKRHTLLFVPDQPLPFNTAYSGTLDMAKLFPENDKLKPLELHFTTSGREIESISGHFVLVKPTDPKRLYYQAAIKFTVTTEKEMIKKSIEIELNGKEISFDLEKDSKSGRFILKTEKIIRAKRTQSLIISIAASTLELSSKFTHTEILAPLSEFIVTAITTRQDEKKPRLQVNFSDELNARQDLRGLVSVDGITDLKYSISGKSLFIDAPFKHGSSYSLTINKGILSAWGTRITKTVKQSLTFEDLKPKMQFSNDGVFLPSSKSRKVAFQTINLKRVKLNIIKVFASNLGQFLQDQNLQGPKKGDYEYSSWELRKVGIQVMDTVLEIGTTVNQWQQHQFDLSKIIAKQDKGLYVLKVSFRKKDMIYKGIDENEKYTGDYWGDTYYNDPLSPGYIYQHGHISKPIVVSDIGLLYMKGYNGSTAIATNILSSAPLSGVTIKLLSFQNQILAQEKTNSNGMAAFGKLEEDVFWVEAEKNGQHSILKLSATRLNFSNFDIGGNAVSSKANIKAFIYSERGVYRPGDSINVMMVVRNENNTFPDHHPVTLKWYNPKNQMRKKIFNKAGVQGFYRFQLLTERDDLTGTWRAEIEIGPETFKWSIPVETVVPFKLKTEIQGLSEKYSRRDRDLKFTIHSKYLFGAPASSLKAEASIEIRENRNFFRKYKNFHFGDITKRVSRINRNIYRGELNRDGKSDVTWKFPNLRILSAPATGSVKVKVFEKGGRPNIQTQSFIISPSSYYPGIQLPESEWGYFAVDKSITIKTLLLDIDGNKIPGKSMKYKIYRNRRYWWWEYRNQGNYRLKYKSDSNTELIEESTFISGSQPVEVSFTPEERGEYLLEISDINRNGSTSSIFFQASRWGDTAEGEDAGILTINADKSEYAPGERARLQFPVTENARVLLTLEKGGKIISTEWVKPRIEDFLATLEINLTKEMVPNVYASITVIQPHSQTVNDRPLRTYGLVPLTILDKRSKQEIIIESSDEFKSKKPFSVVIQTKDHKRTQYTVAVVDEGLLALTNFRTPDPLKFFNAKIRLTLEFFDIFSQVIGVNKGDFYRLFSIGGGVMDLARSYRKKQAPDKKAQRFKPVSMVKGPFWTDDNGRGMVTFVMPEYIGAVRIMLVSANENRYGSAEKTVPVKTDLMLLPSFPRVLSPGDKIKVPVSIFAMKDNLGPVVVIVSTSGPLSVSGKTVFDLNMQKAGEKDIVVDMQVQKAIGIAKIKITASAGKTTVEHNTEIRVRPSSPHITRMMSGTAVPGETISFDIPGDAVGGSGKARLIITRREKVNIHKRLNWLMRYPYGCIEQTVSAVFPQLTLKSFLPQYDIKKGQIDRNINTAINRLRNFQLPSGGFSYWPGSNRVSHWGSNYAGHFLIEAKKMGYFVPQDLLDHWIRNAYSVATAAEGSLKERAYRLYVLALNGQPNLAAMNLLRENSISKMKNIEKWLLAGAYYLAANETSANKILRNATLKTAEYGFFDPTFGSRLRDKGIMMDIAMKMKHSSQADDLYEAIVKEINSDQYYSTQSLGYSLLSLGKYMELNRDEFLNSTNSVSGYYRVENGPDEKFDFTEFQFNEDLSASLGKKISITIDSGTELKKVYLFLEWEGIPLEPLSKAITRNLSLRVRWYNENGMTINPEKTKQGMNFWARYTLQYTGKADITLKDMALVSLLPSGWEIDNTRLSGEARPAWMSSWSMKRFEYQDIRDDKVMWFFNMNRREKNIEFVVKLNAVTAGQFTLPAAKAEAMYNTEYIAVKPGKKVTVTRAK